jgi:hypothetical protein
MEVICLTPRKEEEETLTSVTGIEIEMEQQQPGSPVPVKQSRHLFLPESRQNEEASRCSFIVLDSWLFPRHSCPVCSRPALSLYLKIRMPTYRLVKTTKHPNNRKLWLSSPPKYYPMLTSQYQKTTVPTTDKTIAPSPIPPSLLSFLPPLNLLKSWRFLASALCVITSHIRALPGNSSHDAQTQPLRRSLTMSPISSNGFRSKNTRPSYHSWLGVLQNGVIDK